MRHPPRKLRIQPTNAIGLNREFADDTARMISLLLRRQRQKSGLSLAEAADRLGARSRDAYARYEQGRTVPTVAKLDELLKAVAPGRDLLVGQSKAA